MTVTPDIISALGNELIGGNKQRVVPQTGIRHCVIVSVEANQTCSITMSSDGVVRAGIHYLTRPIVGGTYIVYTIGNDYLVAGAVSYPDAFVEIGRNVLTSSGDTLQVTGLPDMKYLRVYVWMKDNAASIRGDLTFNSDTANNYAYEREANGAADTANVSQANILITRTSSAQPMFTVLDIRNFSGGRAIAIANSVSEEGAAGNSPGKIEFTAKWSGFTSISTIKVANGGAGDFDIGSELLVLGAN